MREIWNCSQELSIPDLIGNLNKKYHKGYARTTVTTFLVKLQAKGYVDTYRKGKLSYVFPVMSLEEYKKKVLKEVVDFWYLGNVEDVKADLNIINN